MMKNFLLVLVLATMLVATVISANVKLSKTHVGMKGKDDLKIGCVYCHQTAKIQKKKGQNIKQFNALSLCAAKGCHPLPPK
jgi:hypothetical protein